MDMTEQQRQKTFSEQKRKEYSAAESSPLDERDAQQRQRQTFNPDNPPWGVWSALGLWAFSVFAIFLISAVAVAGYMLVSRIEINPSNMMENPAVIIVSFIATLPAHLVTLAAAWLLVTRARKLPFWCTLGWTWKGGFGLQNCILITLALLAVGVIITNFVFEHAENDLERMLKSSRMAVYMLAVVAVFTAPLVEEVVYRGVLYPVFNRKFGTAAAVIIVTVLFSIIHVPQYFPSYGVIIMICLLSLALTLIRARTKSLLPCFFIHTLFNGIQAILLIIEPYLTKH